MLIPKSSELYSYNTKVTSATGPRFQGSVVLDKPSNNPEDYNLSIVYRRYIRKAAISQEPKVNILFQHGTGMSKSIWHYHIDKLYNSIPNLNCVIAPDQVNHGESAALNQHKLGQVFSWTDGTKDLIKVVKIDEAQQFLQPNSVNIFIGHSMGGQMSLVAAYLEPTLFDAVVPLNPVCHISPERAGILEMVFNTWHQRDSIRSEFPIKEGEDPKQVIYDNYKKRSFFKTFHDTVLQNMLEDEVPPKDDIREGTLYTNTRSDQEYFTYFSGTPTILRSYPIFSSITTPVYHVVGSFDTAGDVAINETREALHKVLHPIDIDEATHIVNGEKPDVFISIIQGIVKERIEAFSKDGDIRYHDASYLKKYGESYKSELKKISFDQGLGPQDLGPKL